MQPNQPAAGGVTFTMQLSPQAIAALRAGQAANATLAPGGQPGANAQAQQQSQQQQQQRHGAMMGALKPLVQLYLMHQALLQVARHSAVANTYLGAMGKVFGAAIDMLLLPFVPIFNLILVGLTKLTMWLAESGVLDAMLAAGIRAASMLEGIASWTQRVFGAVRDLDLKELGSLIVQGVVAGVRGAIGDPKGAAMLVGGGALAAGMLNLATFGLAGKLAAAPFRAAGWAARQGGRLFGRTPGTVAPAPAGAPLPAGAPAAVGAGSRVIPVAGNALLAATAGYFLGDVAARATGRAGFQADAMRYGLAGAGAGAVVGSAVPVLGTGVGALVGGGLGVGAAGLKSLMGGGGSKAGGGAQGAVTNSYNTVQLTQHNYMSGGSQAGVEAVDRVVQEVQARTGYAMVSGAQAAGRSYDPSRARTSASSYVDFLSAQHQLSGRSEVSPSWAETQAQHRGLAYGG